MAGPGSGSPSTPQAPGQNGTIDVKPADLFRVSSGVAMQQTPMDRGAKGLLDKLRQYPDAGGYGTPPQAFAASCVKVGNRFLDVWARSVVSIGGAAVDFTSTANNYAKAEAANDPTGRTKAVTQPSPSVIEKVPDYGSVPNLKWGGRRLDPFTARMGSGAVTVGPLDQPCGPHGVGLFRRSLTVSSCYLTSCGS
ncbi:hypothetical protein ACWF9X_00275 [Streptomyces globisporus]